ncbi:MAG: HAD family hydrolase [Candidatus Thorarchaeota archaeon]|jgi:phosphoglycolate phosphatase
MTDKLRCNAVIFDFDGTLADSMPFLSQIGVEVMMRFYDIPEDEASERYKSTTGLPYEHQIKINFPDHEMNDEAIRIFEEMKIDRIFEQRLFPESEYVLKNLQKRGFKLFVSSSTFQSTITEFFDRLNLLGYFKEILGYRPGFEKGAHHFNHVHEHHDISLAEVVFIGDSIKDFERSDGHTQFVALEGMFSKSNFREAGHTGHVIVNLSSLEDILESIPD